MVKVQKSSNNQWRHRLWKSLDDALNYQNIEIRPEGISKIKLYISKYNWEGIECPAGPNDWKKFEQNNKIIALNILFAPRNTETIRVVYRSEYKHKCEEQVNLLMITDGNKWQYQHCLQKIIKSWWRFLLFKQL